MLRMEAHPITHRTQGQWNHLSHHFAPVAQPTRRRSSSRAYFQWCISQVQVDHLWGRHSRYQPANRRERDCLWDILWPSSDSEQVDYLWGVQSGQQFAYGAEGTYKRDRPSGTWRICLFNQLHLSKPLHQSYHRPYSQFCLLSLIRRAQSLLTESAPLPVQPQYLVCFVFEPALSFSDHWTWFAGLTACWACSVGFTGSLFRCASAACCVLKREFGQGRADSIAETTTRKEMVYRAA